MNKKIGIIVGEDADLPTLLIKKEGIVTFPFVLDWKELVDSSKVYFQMRTASSSFPKTSQPPIATFKKIFDDNLRSYQSIIVVCVSSKFSGTYNSAIQAKKMFIGSDQSRINIIDSESSTGAEGLLVLKAIELIKTDEVVGVVKKLIEIVPKLNLIGVFDDPRWLVAGGRISSVKGMLVKNMLKAGFRPVLTIRDGEIVVKKIQMNAKDKAEAIFSQLKSEVGRQNHFSVAITHADCPQEAEKLASKLAKFYKSAKIEYIHEISPVVGVHLGPDTLLLSWISD